MKFTKINPSIKLLTIALKGQEVGSKGLIDISLLDEILEVTVVGLKREIALFEGEKRLKDLHNSTDVHLIGVHDVYSELQETGRGDVC
ncbi:unnamed protein product [Spirodela intermedia]|uniref:Uncharacterized protein n=2 Tax=Spirodela intermedia TaxID=51605 RepID=A0A7I8KNZ9_SPIIN|nr:unnamed protein product [Spirodela intermedia]CAA6662619.1 unnamed protein product [Spirodela intermedia]CAA7399026.1 unnamed protein product [Spirodela intermedia]